MHLKTKGLSKNFFVHRATVTWPSECSVVTNERTAVEFSILSLEFGAGRLVLPLPEESKHDSCYIYVDCDPVAMCCMFRIILPSAFGYSV